MSIAQSQRVEIHVGAVRNIAPLLEELAAARVLLVLDETAYRSSGAAESLEPCWGAHQVRRFGKFQINPKIEDVRRGVALFRDFQPQAIVAIGGGTAIDLAKLISVCGANAGAAEDYILGTRPLVQDGPPLIAVPTTAGTGSEATHFAVAYVDNEKYSLAHDYLLPEFALLDPALTASLPPAMTAASGLDALCQAMESLWAVHASQESIGYATQAATLALAHLQTAVRAPTPEARLGMMRAAHLSGKAINLSKTTAPHAVSYALTTHYGLPHGVAVALTLGAFLEYNHQVDEATCCDPRGVEHVRERIARLVKLLGGESLAEARNQLESLILALGCFTRFRQLGIRAEDLPQLVAEVNTERLANNPRTVGSSALLALLESIH